MTVCFIMFGTLIGASLFALTILWEFNREIRQEAGVDLYPPEKKLREKKLWPEKNIYD